MLDFGEVTQHIEKRWHGTLQLKFFQGNITYRKMLLNVELAQNKTFWASGKKQKLPFLQHKPNFETVHFNVDQLWL